MKICDDKSWSLDLYDFEDGKIYKKSAYIWALNYAKQHQKGVGTFSDPKVAGQS